METAVIYARYSCENQTEQSIEGQLHVCQDYAKSKGIVILGTYIDRAMSGTNDNRPDFQRMIKDSHRREWKYVIVYKLDRFSRNKYEMAMHKKTLKDNGIKLVSAMEYIPDSPEAIIIESMLEGYAEYYSAELSQKVRRGMRETRLKGNYTGGRILYGFRIENHKVKIEEEQAEVIRYIFTQYAMGVYVKDIQAELKRQHIFNHGKPFARTTIYNILANEKYAGLYHHDGELFPDIYPAIVPMEIYEKVQSKMTPKSRGKRSYTTDYIFKGKITCGYCGSSVCVECGTSKQGNIKRYYKCNGRKKQNGCKKSNIQKDKLEQIVLDTVIEAISKPDVLEKLVQHLLDVQEKIAGKSTRLASLTKDKREIETSLDNIMKAVEMGVVNNTTQRRMNELETQLKNIEEQMLIERAKTTQLLSADTIRAYYQQAILQEPKLLSNYLIKHMVLYDDRVEITLNSPQMGSPEKSQGFPLFISQKYSVRYYEAEMNAIVVI